MTANPNVSRASLDRDEVEAWDVLPVPVLVMSPEGAARSMNRALRALIGVPAAAASGDASSTWWQVLDPLSATALRTSMKGERDINLDLRLLGADGGLHWLECKAAWRPGERQFVIALHDVSASRNTEFAARAQAEQLRLLADNVPALIAYYQAGMLSCLFANRQYAHTFGFDEVSIIGRSLQEIIGEAAALEIKPHVDEMVQHRHAVAYERRLPAADGSQRWIEVNLLPHINAQGELVAGFVLINDITKFRLAERAVRESEDRLSKFMEASAEGIVFHKDGIVTDVNPPLLELLGASYDEMLGRPAADFIASDQLAYVMATIASGVDATYESAVVHKDGRRIPVEFIGRTMLHNGEKLRMTVVRDLRDRIATQQRIHYLAHHDALTGLPNRAALMDQLGHHIAAAQAVGAQMGLLFIDLDHFKRVNDSLGHLAGDALLRTVAERITQCLRTTDLVARLGGDEFVVLLSTVVRVEDVEEVSRKLLAAVGDSLDIDGRPISVTPSIGIAMFPADGKTPDELIKHADTAMYLAKSSGRATYRFFDASLVGVAYDALVIEGELGQALERGEFELYFQPQVRLDDGLLSGVEALIRWHHPERGLQMPDDFIPVAEARRLMLPIGEWVLREALRCTRRWREHGVVAVPVAVNLSTVQFESPGFVDEVERILREEGVPGEWLELELTERMLMEDLPEVKNALLRLKALGIRIAVDDFGTGYTSLRHLKELPIDKMKIDGSFVRELPAQHASAAITRAMIQLARNLDMSVVAEGVETVAQRQFLTRHGCTSVQGSAVGQAMSAADLERWMARSGGTAGELL